MTTTPVERMRRVYSGWPVPKHELEAMAAQQTAQQAQQQVDLEDLIERKVAERMAQAQAGGDGGNAKPTKGKPKLVEPAE